MKKSKTKSTASVPTGRIGWLDMAKGYGIILVIFAHLDMRKLGDWIYSFHIPLFFFLSGYVFNAKYDFKTILKKKCKSILIPYFSLGILLIAFWTLDTYYLYDGGAINFPHYRDVFLNFLHSLVIQKRFTTLWYIACLFFLNIVFYGLAKVFSDSKKLFLVTVCMLLAGLRYYHLGGSFLPWNIDVILPASVFFSGGYWLKSHYSTIREHIDRNKSIVLFAVLLVINIWFSFWGIKISGNKLDMFATSYGFPPLTIVAAFAGIFCVLIFSHWFECKSIKYIGSNSMVYFAWHQTMIMPIARFLLKKVGISSDLTTNYAAFLGVRITELLVILALCTICQLGIAKSKLKFMTGR
jgi:fucose 4-O-acetylase-like acetyltransferase